MYDLIARTAGLILVGLFFAVLLWGRLHLPVPWFIKRFWAGSLPRRVLFIVAALILLMFLMLVIDWASEHQRDSVAWPGGRT